MPAQTSAARALIRRRRRREQGQLRPNDSSNGQTLQSANQDQRPLGVFQPAIRSVNKNSKVPGIALLFLGRNSKGE
jgi:hypothetical protein